MLFIFSFTFTHSTTGNTRIYCPGQRTAIKFGTTVVWSTPSLDCYPSATEYAGQWTQDWWRAGKPVQQLMQCFCCRVTHTLGKHPAIQVHTSASRQQRRVSYSWVQLRLPSPDSSPTVLYNCHTFLFVQFENVVFSYFGRFVKKRNCLQVRAMQRLDNRAQSLDHLRDPYLK